MGKYQPKITRLCDWTFKTKDIIVCDPFFRKPIFILIVKIIIRHSQSRYGLDSRPASLFYLSVRVYTVKAMNFRFNEAVVQ